MSRLASLFLLTGLISLNMLITNPEAKAGIKSGAGVVTGTDSRANSKPGAGVATRTNSHAVIKSGAGASSKTTAPAGSRPGGGTILDQGVKISYEDSGSGKTAGSNSSARPTLLFVHGWCINKAYWSGQVDYFKSTYRVVTLDLPGFGLSGKNRKDWSVEAYGRDITAVLTQLNLHHVILIGHSMAGQIIVEAASHNPDRIIGLVGVDNLKDIGQVESAQSRQDAANFYAAARENFKPLAFAYANESLFSKSTDSVVRNRVLDDISRADSSVAISCMEQGDSYPLLSKLIRLKRKIYLINSDVTPTDTHGYLKYGIPFKIFTLHGSGHFPMIEQPDEFDYLLEDALAMILKPKE